MPLRRSPASSSNSLPKPQLPTFLPRRSSTELMPESAQDTCSVALRSKIWAMLTTFAPSSRGTKARGTHDTAKSAPPESSTGIGTISTAPLQDGHVEAQVLVEALVEGGVVAGELRLGEPLQLHGHLGQPVAALLSRRRCGFWSRCGRRFRGGRRHRRRLVVAPAGSRQQPDRQQYRQQSARSFSFYGSSWSPPFVVMVIPFYFGQQLSPLEILPHRHPLRMSPPRPGAPTGHEALGQRGREIEGDADDASQPRRRPRPRHTL